jgi:predicted phosphodiesterase
MLKIYAKCGGKFIDCAKSIKVSKTAWTKRWYDIGLKKPDMSLNWKISDENYDQVAIISDLHLGNFYQQRKCINNFIKICKERSIDTLLCGGDITDGMMNYPSHEKERFLHSPYSYEEYCEDNYPDGFKNNCIISGNHDNSLTAYENSSYDFCRSLSKVRKDLIYHKAGDDNVTKAFDVAGGVKILLYHGSNCANPAIGQKREPRLQQKTAEMLSNDSKFNIAIYGHCHRRCTTNFMEKYILGVGCFIADTPYQVDRGTHGDICGLILKYASNKGEVTAMEAEYITLESLGGIRRRDF